MSRGERLLFAISLALLLMLTACSGGGSSNSSSSGPSRTQVDTTPTLTISPPAATVTQGSTIAFNVTLTNLPTGTGATFTATAGTFSGTGTTVTYTAPGQAGTYTVTAATIDNKLSATSTITVIAPPPPPTGYESIRLSPSAASITAGTTLALTATQVGSSSNTILYTTSGGTISGTGAFVTYTAPSAAGTYIVTATTADGRASSTSTITVTSPPPPTGNVGVSLNPAVASISTGGTTTLTATVTGTTNTAVSYSATGGTISGTGTTVTYGAPGTPGTYIVTVTTAFGGATARSTITVTTPPPPPSNNVIVSISPQSVTIPAGSSTIFTATVSGTTNTSFAFTATAGTLVSQGSSTVYTAPATAGTYTVVVKSGDPSGASATATVNVTGSITRTNVAITLLPNNSAMVPGQPQIFTASVSGSTDTSVTFTVTGGTITGTGNQVTFTAPQALGTYGVTAIANADPSKTAFATITVVPQQVQVSSTDSTSTIYGTIQNAICGQTVNIQGGTYSMTANNLVRIFVTQKKCTPDYPLIIQAADPNNLPLFDYSGYPLLGPTGSGCLSVPGTYAGSDCDRGAWQIWNSSYVTIDGIHLKGVTSAQSDNAAAFRYIDNDHLTLRRSVIELSFNGAQGHSNNTLFEYDQFINNGSPANEQEHQIYDGGGDNTTIRYSYFNADGCCIKTDGTIDLTGSGGQNLHERAYHSYIYGNWFQNAKQYEFDMMTPDSGYDPGDHIMRMYFYGNVVIPSASPASTAKVITFLNDSGYLPGGNHTFDTGIFYLDAQWNTFYMPFTGSQYTNSSIPPNSGDQYSLFQLNNYGGVSGVDQNIVGGIDVHLSNNVIWFHTNTGGSNRSLMLISSATHSAPWAITGDNNWFDSKMINTCLTAQTYTASNGSCSVPGSVIGPQTTPPFVNAASYDFTPISPGAFGAADTTQTLQAPTVQYAPMKFRPRMTYTDPGAIDAH